MRYLKTNTATIVTVGPFYDKTDGVTIETALTITNERITFVVDNNDGSAPTLVLDNVTGATSGTSNDLNYITSNDAGLMQLELAAANVNYLGRAMLTITDAANHCPVFHEFMILPAMVYDSLIVGTDVLQADMTQILGTAVSTPATAGLLDVNAIQLSGDATAANNAESFFDGTGYAGTNNVIPTVTTVGTTTNLTNLPAAAALEATLTAMKGATFAGATDSLEALRDRGDAAWATATGFATPTNITAGTITTVTNLTNAATNGDLTATMKTSVTTAATAATPTAAAVTGAVGSVTGAVGSVTGAVGSVTGAVGSVTGAVGSVTGNVGGNVAGSVASVTAPVTAGTVSDKTGYALSSAGVQAIWDALTSALTAVGSVGKRIADNLDATISSRGTSTYAGGDTSGTTTLLSRIVGTLATGTHNPQTGDAYARLGAPAGASVSADVAAVKAQTAAIEADTQDLQTQVGTAGAGLTALATQASVNAIDDFLDTEVAAILADTNELQTDWTNGGRLDLLLDAASSAGDPWATALPGAYGAGSAGKIIGDNIDATVSSRSTFDEVADDVQLGIVTISGIKAGLSTLTEAGVRTAVGMGSANLDTQLGALPTDADVQTAATAALNAYDPPTNAEMEARTLAAASYATASALDAVDNFLDTEVAAIKAVTDKVDTALELDGAVYRYTVNALELAPSGGSAPSAADIRAEIDANSTQLAAIVEDTGTTLPAQIALISGNAGSGAISFPVTVNDEDSNPIDGVEVWISTDSAGTSVVAGTLSTDALGLATFMLDAGTYYLWRQKSGYNFANPVTIVVS